MKNISQTTISITQQQGSTDKTKTGAWEYLLAHLPKPTWPGKLFEKIKAAQQTRPAKKKCNAFYTEEINLFWPFLEKSGVENSFLAIYYDILVKLDQEPDTSSLGTFLLEKELPPSRMNDYVLQAKIPLWQHSLDVAKIYISSVSVEERRGLNFSLEVLACLAHDIGKLYILRPESYQSREHPTYSATSLELIIADRLPNAEIKAVIEGVALHHGLIRDLERLENKIPLKVCLADRKTRGK